MIEIRTEIFDYLHKNGPTSLNSIAEALGQSLQAVETAVDHEWFAVRAEVVAIAMHETDRVESRGGEHAMSEDKSDQILRDLFGSGG